MVTKGFLFGPRAQRWSYLLANAGERKMSKAVRNGFGTVYTVIWAAQTPAEEGVVMTTATSDDYDITFSNYPPILDQRRIGPAMSRRDPKSKRRIEPCTNDRGLALARF
jgi:hypothetical protein